MKKAQFQNPWMPYMLLAPQMIIIAIFFLWPAFEAIRSSFYIEDPFFGNATFVGFENYVDVTSRSDYQRTAWFTFFFTVAVAVGSLGLGLWFAVAADKVLRGQGPYKTLLMWVYAIAPPVAGLIGVMLFDQHIGPLVEFVAIFGWDMQIGVDYGDTAFAMTVVATWKQIPYNFIFFLSGLQGGVLDRLPLAHSAVLDDHLSAAGADLVLPVDPEHHLRLLRDLRRHRSDGEGRAGQQPCDAGLQGVSGRLPGQRSGRLGSAIGHSDDPGAGADGGAVPADRAPDPLLMRGAS